jgi:biotin carboxyl carrier protein
MNEFMVRIDGNLKQIKILDDDFVEVDNVKFSYALTELDHSKFILKINNKIYETSLWNKSNGEMSFQINNSTIDLSIRTTLQEKAYQLLSASQSDTEKITTIKSPMPGLVLKILKNVGDEVQKSDTVMILEAMKMENEIKSSIDGIITEVNVSEGKPVEKYISLFSVK